MRSSSGKEKILLVSYSAYPLFQSKNQAVHGGAEVDMYNIASHLDQKKFDIHFIVGNFGQPRKERVDGITIHAAQKVHNASAFSGITNAFALFILIRKINPDVILAKSLGWLTVELIIIKILLRKKLVFRSSHRKNIDGSADTKPYGKAFRILIKHIDHFLIQNKEDEQILIKNYSFKGPITHIPNLHPIKNIQVERFTERKHFLWIGRSELIKNPGAYLEIAKSLPNESFQMILTETDKAVYEDTITKAMRIPNISIINKMPHLEVLEYFSYARYFITTSFGEGFPNVLIESFSKGTPVLSLYIDFDHMITKEKVGFVGDGSIQSIVAFIKSIDESNWETLSNNAYNLAKNNFEIHNRIQSYEKIFLQI